MQNAQLKMRTPDGFIVYNSLREGNRVAKKLQDELGFLALCCTDLMQDRKTFQSTKIKADIGN